MTDRPNDREMELALSADVTTPRRVANLLASYRRELLLKWTREPPTRPGRYWLRELSSYTTLVLVEDYMEEGLGLQVEEYGQSVDDMPEAQWAGPIPEPEET